MYGKAIQFAINKNVQRSTIHPSSFFSSASTHYSRQYKFSDRHYPPQIYRSPNPLEGNPCQVDTGMFATYSTKNQNVYVCNRNLVDDIRESASGLPPTPSSASRDDRVKTSIVDDIRESASGLPPTPPSSTSGDDRVNAVKTSTTPTSDRRVDEDDGDTGSFVADAAKQGVAKAMETGLEMGEMAKKTLDNVWDVTKDTTHKVKEAVTGDKDEKYDVPPTDRFVDDLRKHADGYDRRRNNM